MSLINDALKRAEESQSLAPAEGAVRQAMKPIPDASSTAEPGIWLPSIGGALVLGAALIAGIYFLRAAEGETKVRARTTEKSAPSIAAVPAPTTPSEKPVNKAELIPGPAAPAPLPEPALTPIAATPSTEGLARVNPPEIVVATPVPRVAKTPDLKLQAIIAHPKRPSAIIDGNTLFVGDSIRGSKLVGVTAGSITLSGPNGQQVLRLDK